jgi:hypothetical protein
MQDFTMWIDLSPELQDFLQKVCGLLCALKVAPDQRSGGLRSAHAGCVALGCVGLRWLNRVWLRWIALDCVGLRWAHVGRGA